MNRAARTADWALVLGAPVVDTLLFSRLTEDPDRTYWTFVHPSTAIILVAGAGLVFPLWLRRRAQVTALLLLIAYSAVLTLSVGSRPLVSLLIGIFAVASRRRWIVSLGCVAVTLPVQGLAVAYEVSGLPAAQRALDGLLVSLLFLILDATACGLGMWAGWSRRQRVIIAQHSAAEAVAFERARIGRDMHDVVAHTITHMLLQSGGAAKVMLRDPDQARSALTRVDDLGQQAIVELHRMLDTLSPGAGSGNHPDLELRDFVDLVDQATASGLRIELALGKDLEELPPGLQLSAYRIVQEAITNATRYADRAQPVSVDVKRANGVLEISIQNGRAAHSAPGLSTGHGLLGMRERVSIANGSLWAGDRPDGTYLVRATLPLAVDDTGASPLERLPRPSAKPAP